MTVSSETARMEYAGNDVTVEFAVSFYFFIDGDIDVYLDDTLQTIVTHYTVAGAGNPAGGTVTMVAAPATGETLTIIRDVALTQGTDYVENSSFPADSHEDALDRAMMVSQQLQEQINRAIIASPESQAVVTMPSPEAKKGLVWNDAGTDLVNTTDALNDIVTDAEAAQTAAETAQTNAETAETNAETAETNAETAETNAAASAVLADKWATEVEDTPVSGDEYSAYHWAQKSEDFALTAVQTTNANEFTQLQNHDAETLSISSSTVDWDMTASPYAVVSATEDFTLNAPSNKVDGGVMVLRVENTGAFGINFNAAYDWGDQDTPDLVSGADKDTIFVFTSDGTRVYGVSSWSDSA